ncbi:hypothetical protein EQG64_34275 [Streptomyces sp. S6]|nr:hypothetical protein EQG64_34275 [Streptomyces sp. S6]
MRYRLDDLRLEDGHGGADLDAAARGRQQAAGPDRDGQGTSRVQRVRRTLGDTVTTRAATALLPRPRDRRPDAVLLRLLNGRWAARRLFDRRRRPAAVRPDSVALAEAVALAHDEHGLQIDPSAMFQASPPPPWLG